MVLVRTKLFYAHKTAANSVTALIQEMARLVAEASLSILSTTVVTEFTKHAIFNGLDSTDDG